MPNNITLNTSLIIEERFAFLFNFSNVHDKSIFATKKYMNQHKLSQRLLKLQRVLTKNKVKPITCSITFWAEDIAKNSSGISMKRIMKRSISHKILQMAEKERENKNIEFITTIYSDELYPWLSGKAPWSLEQGKFFQILFILPMTAAVRTKKENFKIDHPLCVCIL